MSDQPSTSHHGRKFLPCDWCNAIFTHDSALYIHQRHECLHRTRYTCKICPRSFYTPGFLQMHMETRHEPLLCDHCPFKCYECAEFVHHMRVHDKWETVWAHRRRSQRKRKNVQCTVCQCNMSYFGKTLSQPKEAPLTEVRIKVESTSPVSEVSIKLEPGSGEHRRKGNLERYRETGDLSYIEQTMKKILLEAPGLLKR